MVIRIPDSAFAYAAPLPSSPVPKLQQSAKAMRGLQGALENLSLAMTAGSAESDKALAKARSALLAGAGSLELEPDFAQALDGAKLLQEQGQAKLARESALGSLVASIKQTSELPLSFAQKAAFGRALVGRAVREGLLGPAQQRTWEEVAASSALYEDTRRKLAATGAPGEALALVEEAKAAGGLVGHDSVALDALAAAREPVEAHRHQARLAWKEADDFALFAKGELPEPLSEDSFRLVHGARGAVGAYARYQTARKEAEVLALIRGKDDEAIEAAQAAWNGDLAVFASALAKDATERRRDPVGYALAAVPGLAQALEETPEAERGALLWSAQAGLRFAEGERSPWTLKEVQNLARRWLALAGQPSGPARDDAMVTLLTESVLKLPREQRPGAIAALEAQGLDHGNPGRLRATLAAIEGGSLGLAYLAVSGAGGKRATMAGPRRAQQAQSGEMRPEIPQLSETGRIPLDDPALGAWTAEHFPEVFNQAAGTRIPDYKKLDQAVRRDWIPWQREVRAFGAGEAQNFALMEIFAAEGGLRPTDLGTVFGITPYVLERFGAKIGLDPENLPSSKDLTNPQRLALFKVYLDERDGGLGRAGRYEALETIGDKQVAAAIADVYWRNGGRVDTIAYVLHGAINDVLRSEGALAQRLFQLLQANGDLSSSQASVDPVSFQLGADGKFGAQSLRAVQLIVQDEAARRLLLDGIAERRTQWHLDHPERYPGDPDYDIEKRYPHFRFQ